MRFWESVRVALRSLRVNVLRSLLTMLGVIVGVAAVIAMIAVGSGAEKQVEEHIRSLGVSLLVVLPGAQRSGSVRLSAGSRHTLREADATAIGREVGVVEGAAPKVHQRAQIVWGNRNWSTPVSGVTPSFFDVFDWPVTVGGAFTREDMDTAAKVAVIGTTIVKKLFEDANPLGEEIRIKNVPFTVIGVLDQKGISSGGSDTDDNVYIPLSTARIRVHGGKHQVARDALDVIVVKVTDVEAIPQAKRQIRDLLRQRHRLRAEDPDDFRVLDLTAVQATHRATQRTMSLLLIAVASVSLIVGGISIMNIMLVAVTERTREIGLRLAVGASQRDVRNQFLIESVTLSLVGGLAGIACGVSTAMLIAELAGWPILINPLEVLFAYGFAAIVGVVFGLYPARKASKLNPIEALRFE
jgi:putative ABC transport system permease protein